MDQRGEKGDARRPVDRSNKRRHATVETTYNTNETPVYSINEKVVYGIVGVSAITVAVILFVDDASVIGVADDPVAATIAIYAWDSIVKVF